MRLRHGPRWWLSAALATSALLLAGVTAVGVDLVQAAPAGSISGTVTGPGGAGVPDATVFATPYDGSAGGASATTAADGSYSLTGLAAGSYRVTFVADDFGVAYYPGSTDFFGAVAVVVTDGTDTSHIDQHYTATGGISGRISGEDGVALGGATVAVTGTGGFGGMEVTTGADGTYAATGLADGTYWVNASAAGHMSLYFPHASDLSGAAPVTVAGGAVTGSIDVALPLAGAISGRVTAADGAPAPEVIVTATAGARTGAASTAVDGSYTIDGLAAGDYTVAFAAAGDPSAVEYFDDVTDPALATPVVVVVGATTRAIDARLGPDPDVAPYAVDDRASAREGFGPITVDVLANDTDADGDPLRVVAVSATERGGTATCSTTACVYLPPNDGLIDRDEFAYTVSDGALTDEAVVSVTLHPNAETDESDEYALVEVTAVGGRLWDRHLTLVIHDDDSRRPCHGSY